MPLFERIWTFLKWLGAVLRVFVRTHPFLTPALILARATSYITRLLSFFIPLKVLLLVASPGVPRYFRFLIDPEYRTEWVIALSIGAVAVYLITLLLDKLCDYWCELGSRNLLQQSSQLSIIGNQRTVAKRYYSDFSGVAADVLLMAVILGVGFLVYPLLFGTLTAFLFLQLVVSWGALRVVDPIQPRGFGGYIMQHTRSYLGYLEALSFLAIFAFLIVDFLLMGGVNILAAILSFLMGRRLLSSAHSFVSDAVKLMRERHRIDPLVFLEERYVRKRPRGEQKLAHLFNVADRRQRLLQNLELAGVTDVSAVESRWIDTGSPGFYFFATEAVSASGETRFSGLEQVVRPDQQQVLENEALIVEQLGRGVLRMADVVYEYEIGGYLCRLLDLTASGPVSAADWKNRFQTELMLHFYSLEPGAQLRRIFEPSRHYLHERLTAEMLQALAVAIDSPAKQEIYHELFERLPEIRRTIASLPLFPYNRALAPRIVYLSAIDRLTVTEWGRWSIEPIGVGLEPERLDDDRMGVLYSALLERGWTGPLPSTWQLNLAARAYLFEEQILLRGRFNEALELGAGMLKDLRDHAAQVGHADAKGIVNRSA